MRKKRWLLVLVVGVLASLLIAAILAIKAYSVSVNLSQHTPHELYDYYDATRYLPASLQAGMDIDIDWQGYPAKNLYLNSTLTNPKVAIDLSVELVPEAVYTREPYCSKYTQVVPLDVVHTTNWNGADTYQRSIQIPQHIHPGVYELIRSVKSAAQTGCFGVRVVLLPSS